MEVTEQAVADEFIVEAQGVVAQCAGAGARQLLVDAVEGFGLADALGQGLLRGDAGDQGSRSSAGRTKKLTGVSISLRSASVRMAAYWEMRVRRGSWPKVSRS